MPTEFISYYRVSTTRQGTSGLGLEAQRSAAKQFVEQSNSRISREFTEVESGKRNNRPQLAIALDACNRTGATLLIAKLDRLARNVHFISGLLESSVRFIAVDMPNADRFMLHVYAAMAEEECRRISERTKLALASAKARGVKLGDLAKIPEKRNSTQADEFAQKVGPTIKELQNDQNLSFREIASELNRQGLRSFRDRQWHATTVHRVHNRYVSICLNNAKQYSSEV